MRAYESVNGAHVTKRAICKGGRGGEAKTGEITHNEGEGDEGLRYGMWYCV